MNNRILNSSIKILSYSAVVLAYGVLTVGAVSHYQASGTLADLGLVVVNALFVIMYVTKSDAVSVSKAPAAWMLAFLGTCLPLVLRSTSTHEWSEVGVAIQILGIASIAGSLLSLRRSFGIVPANRGVRTAGMYHLVRHPLYSSELLWMAGFVIANPSPLNISLWCGDCLLQYLRANAEERLLSADATYVSYKSRVRYRFVPRIV